MDALGALALVFGFAVLGTVAGIGTGLVPGLHVNNVALLVLVAEPNALAVLAILGRDAALLALVAFLAAASVSHGIAAFLPSVYLGAPEADTALSVLPGHRLLAGGRGAEGVALAARGAFLATLLAIPLLLPFRLLLAAPVEGYARIRPALPFLLLFLLVLLVATEGRGDRARGAARRAWACALLLLSGLLGLVVLDPGALDPSAAPVPLPGPSLALFPLFTGLFGLPTLILSMGRISRLPPQAARAGPALPRWRRTRGLFAGTLAGAAVSAFPGLGGANATVIAQLLAGGEPEGRLGDGDREFLHAVGAAGASTTVFTFATLFILQRTRSGVAAAIEGLGAASPWTSLGLVPPPFAALLLALPIGAVLAYEVVSRLAPGFARFVSRIPYGPLARAVAMALVIAIGLGTGATGLLVAGTATSLGLCAPLVGVRRVHLMGCLLVPLLAGGL